MEKQLILQAGASRPASPIGRIHYLEALPMTAPNDDKVQDPTLFEGHRQGWAGIGEMLRGDQNLSSIQAELLSHLLDGVDGGAIHIGLTSFS